MANFFKTTFLLTLLTLLVVFFWVCPGGRTRHVDRVLFCLRDEFRRLLV